VQPYSGNLEVNRVYILQLAKNRLCVKWPNRDEFELKARRGVSGESFRATDDSERMARTDYRPRGPEVYL
jgi:hypothetical protein